MDAVDVRDEIDRVAEQLEAEVPWVTCGKLLTHDGWRDVVTTIQAISPDAYAALVAYTKKQQVSV